MGLLIRWLMILSLLLNTECAWTADFPKKKIQINGKTITVEVAETPAQQQQGLMFREKLAANAGMIFVFPDEDIRSFWMKNTYIDLSIGYFDKNRKLIDIQDMKATSVAQTNFPSYVSRAPAQYALEMNQGWFKKQGVKLGDKFSWH